MHSYLFRCSVSLSILLLSCSLSAQTLPAALRIDKTRHQLIAGDQPNRGLYDQSIVRNYYLYFNQPDYWHMMDSIYWCWTRSDIPATLVVDGVTYPQVGVRFKGQSSFQQVQGSEKKSFDITLDYQIPGQNIMGYKNLNLNNSFQDPSFIGEVLYQHLLKKHIPEAMSCYARLFINGAYWGLYPQLEQLNTTFLKEWYLSNNGTFWRCDRPNGGPAGYGDGTGALNYLGPDTSSYQPNYILKSTSKINPWDDLVHTCDVLNNTPIDSLPLHLPAVLDVDRTLWFLASENLFSDDDSYIQKGRMDYFAYWERETGRMAPQEYDGNTVMNPAFVNWDPFYHEDSVNYPLMHRLFQVPEYRQRYLAHVRTLLQEDFNPDTITQCIQNYRDLIDTMVFNDPKKLYTYAEFQSDLLVKEQFMNQKRINDLAHPEVAQSAPVISATSWSVSGVEWRAPANGEAVLVKTHVQTSTAAAIVALYYASGVVGNFMHVKMYDDGLHNDGLANDGVFCGNIPSAPNGTVVRFYIEAKGGVAPFSVSYNPPGAEHNVFVYRVGAVNGLVDAKEDALSIGPVPCGGILRIQHESTAASLVCIYDVDGQKVMECAMEHSVDLDLSRLTNGVYFVSCDRQYRKIVLIH